MDSVLMREYQHKWETRSSVRARPRKTIDFSNDGDFFPRTKQALFLLPEINSLSEKQKKEILLLSFYKYLKDITQLEVHWIHKACHSLMYKNIIVNYSDDIKRDACTVIIDEYYHVYIAYDLMAQFREAFPLLPYFEHHFSDSDQAIITIKNRLDEKYHDVFEIIAVCIFETTLIRELVTYFNSEKIHPTIKYYVNDHMNDEARHFGFFYEILHFTWSQFSELDKEIIGAQLGDFVKLYLNIDGEIAHNKQILEWILNDKEKASLLVDRLYPGFVLSPEIPLVKNVLNVLSKTGILDHEIVKEGFRRNSLLIEN